MSTEGPGTGPRAGAGLDEIREEEAPAATRAIYADIRRATGIPQVNLIFRHLACDPAMLAWAWGMIGPLYRSGAIDAAATRLEQALAVPAGPPVWQALDDRRPDEAARLQAVLAFYDRGNRSNLLGLTALLRAAERPSQSGAEAPATAGSATAGSAVAGSVAAGSAAAGSAAAGSVAAGSAVPAPELGSSIPPADAQVPPLPRRDAVAPEVMALVDDLAARHGSASIGVVPSLYLHLTHWPEAVRAAHAAVAPALGTTEWRRRVDALIAAARGLSDGMARDLGTGVPAPAAHVRERYLRTVRDFVEGPIPQMVLVGRILCGGAARVSGRPSRGGKRP